VKRTERFAGRLSTWLALIGVAIGLGNVWRFPYMMGRHGGSAFLLMYLVLALLFAIPMLTAEFALGRSTRKGPIDAYRSALGMKAGSLFGFILAFSILVANSYYMVVIGNVAYTTWFGLSSGFGPDEMPRFDAGLGDGHLQYAYALGVLLAGAWILIRGVNRGIEAASRWCVPFFGLVVLYLIGYVFTLDGIGARVGAFLAPDFGAIGIRDVFAALGQAFFSISVGGTFMVVYGNYLKDDAHLPATAVSTALGDTAAALMAALFTVPTILYFGLDMAQGPGLIFSTFPKLFALMPAGRFVGALFLLAFNLMAFLSAVAALEVCVSGLRDLSRDRIGRTGATLVIAALEAVLMWPSAHTPSLIGTLDLIFGSGMQIFGAIVAVIALTFGLGRVTALGQIFAGRDTFWTRAYLNWLRFVVPGVLFVILALYVIDSLRQ
jgi:NSS family neurotransmitter:Na+ symporter